MQQYPKNIKRLLREYMAEAYECELHRELAKLDQGFAEWRDGKISSGELAIEYINTKPVLHASYTKNLTTHLMM